MADKVTRRKFLALNLEAAAGFFGNALFSAIEEERGFFRPPGATGELEFLTACTRCGLCRDVCPEGSIFMFTASSGVKLAGTPYMDPHVSPCTFCEKCIEACPEEALSLKGLASRPAIGKAAVVESKCLAFKQVMCDYCMQACPLKGTAIRLVDGRPAVDADTCSGCGLCVQACIAEAKGISVLPS